MSWNAYFGGRDWNYTHNTNGMIAAAYRSVTGLSTDQAAGPLGAAIGPAWWHRLDGMSGPEGAEYLGQIIRGLEASPSTYRAMNPENGWGDHDRLLEVLREMRASSAEDGCCDKAHWHVHG